MFELKTGTLGLQGKCVFVFTLVWSPVYRHGAAGKHSAGKKVVFAHRRLAKLDGATASHDHLILMQQKLPR